MRFQITDYHLRQQVADRVMHAARREEYRNRERTANTAKSAVHREDSEDRAKYEKKNGAKECQHCREDPIGPSTLPVDFSHNHV